MRNTGDPECPKDMPAARVKNAVKRPEVVHTYSHADNAWF